jgi:hypothetical protein
MPDFPVALAVGIAGAVLVLGLTALWFFRSRRAVVPPPRERALRALADLRSQQASAYEFGVRASDILRSYVRDQHGIDATTRTSLEFLEAVRGHSAFDANERASLAAFLEAADLLKFARIEAGGGEIGQLLETATQLVRGGATREGAG